MENFYENDDSVWKASESSVGGAVMSDGRPNALDDSVKSQIPLGKLGFHTDDPYELQKRIDEIDASVDRAEHGDDSEWVTAEEFDRELQREFLWLR